MTERMTEPNTAKKAPKKGAVAKQVGGLCMFLGILVAVISGAFGPAPAILFFGGLLSLIIGVAQRDNDPTN